MYKWARNKMSSKYNGSMDILIVKAFSGDRFDIYQIWTKEEGVKTFHSYEEYLYFIEHGEKM